MMDPIPEEDHGIDNNGADDDDDYEVNTTQPFQPGAASSTPYPGGEEHERTHMGPEHSGLGDTTPFIPDFSDFVSDKDKKLLLKRFQELINAENPEVDFNKIVIGLGGKKENRGKVVALGPNRGETVIFNNQDGTYRKEFLK